MHTSQLLFVGLVGGVAALLWLRALLGAWRARTPGEAALWVGALLAPTTPALLVVASADLPVTEPETHVGSGEFGCADGGSVLTVLLVVVLIYALLRGLPLLIGYLVGRRRLRRARQRSSASDASVDVPPQPRWVRALVALPFVLVLLRLLVGGTPAREFTVYGALTPPHVARWRAALVLATAQCGPARPLVRGQGATPPEVIAVEGSDCCGALAHPGYQRARPAIKAWVAGAPVSLQLVDGQLQGFAAPDRTEAAFPRARRPQFASWPQVAPSCTAGEWIVSDPGAAPSAFAMIATSSTYDRDGTRAVREHEVGLLLAPSWLAWSFAVVAMAIAAALRRRRWAGRRFAALHGWLSLELCLMLLFVYWRYF